MSIVLAWPSAAIKQILVATVVVMPSSNKLGASQCLVKCTKKSYYVPKGLCATEGVEGNIDQDGGGHNIDKASVGTNDRQVRHSNFDKAAVQNNNGRRSRTWSRSSEQENK